LGSLSALGQSSLLLLSQQQVEQQPQAQKGQDIDWFHTKKFEEESVKLVKAVTYLNKI
jgi:hypothetical protein